MGLAGIGLLFAGFVFLILTLVVLLIGAVVVRAAVSFANGVLGPVKPTDTFGQWDDWDSDEPAPKARKGKTRVIPEPNMATGMLITFVSGIVNTIGYVLLGFFLENTADDFDEPNEAVVAVLLILSLPFTAAVYTLFVKLLLPTTFVRAVLVAFFHHIILGIIAFVSGIAVFFAWQALGM